MWSQAVGINQLGSDFYVHPHAALISIFSAILAVLSYKVVPEKHRYKSTLVAYWVLLYAIAALTYTTGATESPFIATWMIAMIFAGLFGLPTLILLFIWVNVYAALVFFMGEMTNQRFIGIILATELPILVSYILWHNKSKSETNKDNAYYDLANQLNQESNKSSVVINAISDGVIAINNEGVIELINPAAQRIVGWGNQDAVGLDYKSVLQILGKDGHEVDKSKDPVFEVLTTNQPVRRSDLQLQTSSGKKLNAEIAVSPIGRLGSGVIIIFRDVTKEQEEGRAQAEFISTASHEMRTPVASIEGYLGLALNPATATIDDKARDFITKAHESAQHLGHLFQDLLDVTKADDGRLSNNPKVVNVVEFTGTIVEGLQPKAEAKGLRIFFKADTSALSEEPVGGGLRNLAPVYYVDLDADHLREVIANLVENAIKYTLAGEVVVDVQGDDTHVVISISDSGIGIPAEDIPHLFQKFYRVDNSDTREIGGTGLGLYLCRRLIETMGGRIWVESEYKKGSTFFVELPRISHEEASRLIEASVSEVKQTDQDKKRQALSSVPEEGDDPDAAHRRAALATPIIMSHAAPVSAAGPVVAPSASGETTVDPLVGAMPTQTVATPPPAAHNSMVLPPSMQDVPSNLQRAVAPAPTPVAAPAPTPPPAPAPATPPATQPTSGRLVVPERR